MYTRIGTNQFWNKYAKTVFTLEDHNYVIKYEITYL